jgi:hypothetical protein
MRAGVLPTSHAAGLFSLMYHRLAFPHPILTATIALWGLRNGGRMPSSAYYHRQADLCVRMALSASAYEERFRLIDRANEYRERAGQLEAVGSHLAVTSAKKSIRRKPQSGGAGGE